MNNYSYTARTLEGKEVKGLIAAEDQGEFFASLKRQGLYCVSYKEESDKKEDVKKYRRMKTKELVIFCRKFGTMLQSGLSITASLEVMYSSAEKPYLREIYLNLFESIQTGLSLSEAMKTRPGVFTSFMLSMIESGEESGTLDTVLISLAEHYEKENQLKAKVRTATAYPMILSIVSIGIIVLLFTVVMPQLFDLFQDQELPGLTLFMMDLSDFLTNWWYLVVLGFALLVLLISNSSKIPGFDKAMSFLKLKLPVFGKFNLMVCMARMARSMAMLYASGVTILNTLRISCSILNNAYITEKFSYVTDAVLRGDPLSESIDRLGIFDGMFISMIRVGEESGNMESVLAKTADYYDMESEVAMQRMISILEPALIVILAGVVLMILMSVVVPMYTGYQSLI